MFEVAASAQQQRTVSCLVEVHQHVRAGRDPASVTGSVQRQVMQTVEINSRDLAPSVPRRRSKINLLMDIGKLDIVTGQSLALGTGPWASLHEHVEDTTCLMVLGNAAVLHSTAPSLNCMRRQQLHANSVALASATPRPLEIAQRNVSNAGS